LEGAGRAVAHGGSQGLLHTTGNSLDVGGQVVGVTNFKFGLEVSGEFHEEVHVQLMEIGAGFSGFDGGLASHDVAGSG